jgi:hypothetical protein
MPTATVEMHLASGRALQQTTSIDPTTGAARFGLAEIPLDRESGSLITADTEGRTGGEEFDDLRAWRAAIAARRQIIEDSH